MNTVTGYNNTRSRLPGSLRQTVMVALLLSVFFSCKKLEISRLSKITTDAIVYSDSVIIATATIVDIAEAGISQHGHCWSIKGEPDTNSNRTLLGPVSEKGEYKSSLTKLAPNTVYYVRAYFTAGNNVTYGRGISFNSSLAGISVSTDGFEFLNTSSVSVAGSITRVESVNFMDYGHCWGTASPPDVNDNTSAYGLLSDSRNFSTTLDGLQMMTSYFARSYAKVDENVYVYGNTIEVIIPDLIVKTDSFVIQTGAKALLKGELVSVGIYPVTDYGHCWAVTTSSPSLNNDRLSLGAAVQAGDFSTTLSNTQNGMVYYYRAYAIFFNTVRYGSVKKLQY